MEICVLPVGAGDIRVLCWSRDCLEGFQQVIDSSGSQEELLETLFMSTFWRKWSFVLASHLTVWCRGQLVAIEN